MARLGVAALSVCRSARDLRRTAVCRPARSRHPASKLDDGGTGDGRRRVRDSLARGRRGVPRDAIRGETAVAHVPETEANARLLGEFDHVGFHHPRVQGPRALGGKIHQNAPFSEVVAQSANYKWNDLEKKSSPWRVLLVDRTGHELTAERITVERLPDLFERAFYPAKTPFSKTAVTKNSESRLANRLLQDHSPRTRRLTSSQHLQSVASVPFGY